MPRELKATLGFLRELDEHNDRAWFTEHRAEYDAARGVFEDFVGAVIDAVGELEDLAGVTPDECMFRIYRDTRFSPDKRPYKTAMSAVIARGGRKPIGRSYYVHIQPGDESFVAGGLHSPTSAELDGVRRAIAADAAPLRAILAAPAFVATFGELHGESLKSAPQGYAKDHPAIDLLRRKQFLVSAVFSDADVLADDLVARVAADCAAMQPFLTYLYEAVAG
jgi:uncharacterized protein (TIGR02453 family)